MENVTIRDIARICNVGVSTVSRAINNHPDINPETKRQILDTIRKYNYVPNNSAQNLKRTQSNTIALITKGVGNPLFAKMIETAQRHVMGKDYAFVLQQVDEQENEIEVAVRLAQERRLKGIIFMGGASRPDGNLLGRLTIPYVFCTVDSKIPDNLKGWGIVAIDNEAESYKIVDYLCRQGHRRIAILTAYEHDTSIGKLRLDGYLRALSEHGIEYDPSLVVHMKEKGSTGSVYTMQNGYKMAMELFESGAGFTALYAISDTIAIGACKAIFDRGMSVPEDISVAGFDGLDLAAYYHPSITTIEQPLNEMALETSRMLFSLIHGKDTRLRRIFKATLREGESVAERGTVLRSTRRVEWNEEPSPVPPSRHAQPPVPPFSRLRELSHACNICEVHRRRVDTMRNEKIIDGHDLSYHYTIYDNEGNPEDRKTALDGVDLEVEKGQFIAVLGHNGSGKSTLARHLNALLVPDGGTLFVGGYDTRLEENVWNIRKQAGMVFQNPDNQIIASVVEEDVGFGPENIGIETDEIWKRVEYALKAVGMWSRRGDSPNRLSGGQKQRVAIAGVIAMRPECIVLDEPTAMLDPGGRKEVIATIRELNEKEKVTVILITHYMEEAVHAHRVIVMDHGRVVMSGTPGEIFSRVEELRGFRLDVPQAAGLAYELRKKGLDLPDGILTNEELVEALEELKAYGA